MALAIPKGSYHELNTRVPTGPAWPLQPCLVGTVGGLSPPPLDQHVAARPLPCCPSRGCVPARSKEAHSPQRAAGWGFPPGSFSRWKGFS